MTELKQAIEWLDKPKTNPRIKAARQAVERETEKIMALVDKLARARARLVTAKRSLAGVKRAAKARRAA